MTSKPNPDPTLLTTQQLLREMALQRDVFESQIKAITDASSLRIEVLEQRLTGMDKAIDLVNAANRILPSQIDEKISAKYEIQNEKFSSVQQQFKERDTRTEQSSKDSKVAVDAALQAAKEAVGEQNKSSALAIAKSEAATTKQIDQLQSLIAQGTKASDEKIADVKERLTRIEGMDTGKTKQVETSQSSTALIVFIIAGFVGLLIVAGGIALAIFKR
jgi:cation transport regulator ChaB